jgi:translation initiation factor 4B
LKSADKATAKDRGEGREVDWTRRGPLPDLPREQNQRRVSERGSGFGGGYEPAPGMERGGSRRGANFAPEGDRAPARDMSNMSWERKGPLSPVPGAAPPMREGRVRNNDAPRERRNSPAWGEGQSRSEAAGSQEGSRPPRERPQVERAPTAAEMDNQWRARMKPDAPAKSDTPTPEPSAPSSPAQASTPATRPRLNLAKRTVSEAQPAQASASSDSKASPFGAARAVDTAAREREVEEKRQIAIREKKETDDKARAAKAAAQKAEKKEGQGSENGNAEGEKKENGDAPKASFSILQHDDEDKETGDEGSEAADASANGDIVEDKAVKSKEFIREPPKGPKNDKGAWRRKSSTPNTPASPKAGGTSEKVEEDGWSTVSAVRKGGKGRGGARAAAS